MHKSKKTIEKIQPSTAVRLSKADFYLFWDLPLLAVAGFEPLIFSQWTFTKN